jgi:sec-independent protein translocase protein TatC
MSLIAKVRRKERDRSQPMTLVEHLEELRRRLVISLGAIGLGSIAGWFIYNPLVQLLLGPYCDYWVTIPAKYRPTKACTLFFNGAIDGVMIKLKAIVFLGLAAALPIVLYQLWAFIVPGLTRKERRYALPFVFASTVLFLAGALVAYLTIPKGLQFLLGFAGQQVVPLLTADKFLGFMMLVALAFGLSFEFPILLIFLTMAGVLTTRKLRDWRRPAILLIALFAAVITPSQDPYTMLAMMVPMYLFYEAAIIVGRAMKK